MLFIYERIFRSPGFYDRPSRFSKKLAVGGNRFGTRAIPSVVAGRCNNLRSCINTRDRELLFCMTKLAPRLSIHKRILRTSPCCTSTPGPRPKTNATARISRSVILYFGPSTFHTPAAFLTPSAPAPSSGPPVPPQPISAASLWSAQCGSYSTNILPPSPIFLHCFRSFFPLFEILTLFPARDAGFSASE